VDTHSDEALWEMHNGPNCIATVELWVVARTDEELRRKVSGVEPVSMSTLRDVADGGAGGAVELVDDELLDAVVTAMDAMRGLLISAWHLPAGQRSARWHRARERLRLLFPPPEQVVAAVRRVTAGGRD
jgi:hypothetical protein